MATNEILYIGEPNDVLLTGLNLDSSGAYQNSQTVTGEVRTKTTQVESDDETAEADVITNGTSIGTFTLSYIAASNGNYRGSLATADAAELVAGTYYWLWVLSSGKTQRRLNCLAQFRRKT